MTAPKGFPPVRTNSTVSRVQHVVESAEEKLVGSLFRDPTYAVPAVRDEITPEDFDNQILGAILREGIALYDETGSVLTFDLAQRLDLNAVGGVEYLDHLEDGVASAKNVLAYIGPIREAAQHRKTEALLEDAMKRVQAGEKVSSQLQSQLTAALSGHLSESRRKLKLTLASSIDPRPARWIWEDGDGGRIPGGEITMTVGGGGVGKSTAHAWFIARITRGQLQGIHYGTPKSAIICASEDSWARTIVPRLMAAGADMDRVFRVEVEERGESMRLTLPVDLGALAVVIRENDVAIVSMDPLMTLIGAKLDTYKDHEVRRALEPLASLADDTGVSILGNGHFNKSQTGDLLSRITGSAAFGQVVRAVLAFARDEKADIFVVSQAKNNLGFTDLPNLAYRIVNIEIPTSEGPASVGRLEWCGQAERSVADLLGPQAGAEVRSALENATEWLHSVLGDGPMLKAEVTRFARNEGISNRTLERAKDELGVVSERAETTRGRPATWRLPYPPTITRQEGLANNQSAQSSGVGALETGVSRQHHVLADNPIEEPPEQGAILVVEGEL